MMNEKFKIATILDYEDSILKARNDCFIDTNKMLVASGQHDRLKVLNAKLKAIKEIRGILGIVR